MPSAALHGTFRFLRHGQFQLRPEHDPRLAVCYLPLLLMAPISRSLAAGPSEEFLDLLDRYQAPYALWLGSVSAFAAIVLIKIARQTAEVQARWFYQLIAASMVLIGGLASLFIYCLHSRLPVLPGFATLVAVSPILPALLFAYFVMRFQLLPLVLERTLVYGAVLMGAMLFHQVVLRQWLSDVGQRYRLDVGVIEGVVVIAVVLMYQPLRRRVGEALQSLIDPTSIRRGDRQRLAVQLASRAGQPASELLTWFAATMPKSFGSELGAGWLCDRNGAVLERAGASHLLQDHELKPILAAIAHSDAPFITRYTASDPLLIEFLDRVRAGALLTFEHDDLRGLFLIGCREWGQPPSDEDLHALALLVEQFGVTLHNSRLQALQSAAEHRVLQQEKLSTLGLIAGSLAHEIKNPLSSIKTITRVLSEELGPQSPHAEDLRMISGEIERLSSSAAELLEAARPPRNGQAALSLGELLSPTLRLLQHLARERRAVLEVSLPEPSFPLNLDQVSLREIVFNLVANGLEAAGADGKVGLICRQEDSHLTIDVYDTGPGFTAEQRAQLFKPFFTTKATGTGLGLYIVARRVRELGGQMDCDSIPRQRTTFSVRFPLG